MVVEEVTRTKLKPVASVDFHANPKDGSRVMKKLSNFCVIQGLEDTQCSEAERFYVYRYWGTTRRGSILLDGPCTEERADKSQDWCFNCIRADMKLCAVHGIELIPKVYLHVDHGLEVWRTGGHAPCGRPSLGREETPWL